jgi:hypothetical protein
MGVLSRKRQPPPRTGEVWWAPNDAIAIEHPTTRKHPVLVLSGSSDANYSLITAGSSTKVAGPYDFVLEVTQDDLEPVKERLITSRLEKPTRFWVHQSRRVPRETLHGFCGRLAEAKMEELARLRALLKTK